jgi:polyhydroxyalkanoate synthase
VVQLLDPSELAERVRRDTHRSLLRARNGLKHLAGVGRPALSQTAKDTVWRGEKVELWRYRSDQRRITTPLVLVHSLVSRSYVFDLVPGNSFVEAMLGRGFDVYLVDWGVPDELEAENRLETYTDDYLPTIVGAVLDESDSTDVHVFGYCFGGLLSLLAIAGNDLPVRSLAVQATPIDFAGMSMTSMLADGRVRPDDLIDGTGNVPPEAMLNSFRVLQPTADLTGYVNLWQHLWNDDYLAAHQTMTQWAVDHIPFPGAAFRQVADLFMQRNLLPTGSVPLGGRTVDLADIAAPFVSIVGDKDHIVPPACSAVLPSLVGSDDRSEMRFPAGHVGLMVGRSAHQRFIPAVANWFEARSVLV